MQRPRKSLERSSGASWVLAADGGDGVDAVRCILNQVTTDKMCIVDSLSAAGEGQDSALFCIDYELNLR
jgi:hypothetical protein